LFIKKSLSKDLSADANKYARSRPKKARIDESYGSVRTEKYSPTSRAYGLYDLV
jgi:hypothetical protein